MEENVNLWEQYPKLLGTCAIGMIIIGAIAVLIQLGVIGR